MAMAREPNAMALATASPDGAPSVRMVLLKGLRDGRFIFFSNYESRKARDLEVNPRASLLFFWPDLERQVRITGTVLRLVQEESAVYFATRPRGSQIGAWASRQSSVLSSRDELEREAAKIREDYSGRDVPMPPYWGGYALSPEQFEFWQGRPDRLHDRLHYTLTGTEWRMERLAP
jgi:pyridoxamine 5'-phosphate oxidase